MSWPISRCLCFAALLVLYPSLEVKAQALPDQPEAFRSFLIQQTGMRFTQAKISPDPEVSQLLEKIQIAVVQATFDRQSIGSLSLLPGSPKLPAEFFAARDRAFAEIPVRERQSTATRNYFTLLDALIGEAQRNNGALTIRVLTSTGWRICPLYPFC
jgi:hypothetical protein